MLARSAASAPVPRAGAGRGGHPVDHQLAPLAGGGEEAVLLVREVGIERGLRHPGAADDVRDGDVAETGRGHRGDHRPQQALALRGAHRLGGQPVPAAGQAGLTLVGAREHRPLVSWRTRSEMSSCFMASTILRYLKALKYTAVLLWSLEWAQDFSGGERRALRRRTSRTHQASGRRIDDHCEDRMTATATDLVPGRRRGSWLWHRQLEPIPTPAARVLSGHHGAGHRHAVLRALCRRLGGHPAAGQPADDASPSTW